MGSLAYIRVQASKDVLL